MLCFRPNNLSNLHQGVNPTAAGDQVARYACTQRTMPFESKHQYADREIKRTDF